MSHNSQVARRQRRGILSAGLTVIATLPSTGLHGQTTSTGAMAGASLDLLVPSCLACFYALAIGKQAAPNQQFPTSTEGSVFFSYAPARINYKQAKPISKARPMRDHPGLLN